MMFLFMLGMTNSFAIDETKQQNDVKEISAKKADSTAKAKENTKPKEEVKTDETTLNSRPATVLSESTIKTIIIMFFIVTLVLIILFFVQLYLKNMFLGFQSIKFIGLSLMFPGICILALIGGSSISDATLATLLGTIAGYVLSREDYSAKDALKKENENLKAKVKELEALLPKK